MHEINVTPACAAMSSVQEPFKVAAACAGLATANAAKPAAAKSPIRVVINSSSLSI
jgi:hypothetical protein